MAIEAPGFRRTIRIVPHRDKVVVALEDDIHCMAVTLGHDRERITRVDAVMERWPWTSCPGAGVALAESFTGLPLDAARAPAQKPRNCTHLYDLAVLAAAHAGDAEAFAYVMRIGDPTGEARESVAELDANGATVLRWHMAANRFTAPEDIAGRDLMSLSSWIATLPSAKAEAARVLQTACLISHGRHIPMERQSDATQMPAKCHSFQPEVAPGAIRFGEVIDFTQASESRRPLDHFDGENFTQR